LIKTEIDMLI